MSTSTGNVGVLAGEGLSGPVNGTQTRSRICPSCGKGIAWDASSCPYCLWVWDGGAAMEELAEPISGTKRVLLYVASLLIPLFGIVTGAVYLAEKDSTHRSVGTRCLALGAVSLLVMPTLIAALLYVSVLGW